MIFHFVSIANSGHIVEQETFESNAFDRNAVAYFLSLIDKGEDFGEDLQEVHLEYSKIGEKSAMIEISSASDDLIMHLLGNTDLSTARKELSDLFLTVFNREEPHGEIAHQLGSMPLALAVLPHSEPEVRTLSRYPIALAAAFFETITT